MFNTLEDKIVELYADVYYFALSRVHDTNAAEEIAQTAIEKALVNIKSLKKKSALKSWLMQITMNEIRLYFRTMNQYFKLFSDQDEGQANGSEENLKEIEDLQSGILEQLVNEEDKVNIIKALNMLDEKYKIVIRLKVMCEYNLIEVSELLGTNVNTVRTRYARGLKLLREEFEKIDKGVDL